MSGLFFTDQSNKVKLPVRMASGGTGTPTDSPEGQVDGGGTLTEPNNPNVGTPADKPTQDDGNTQLLSVLNIYLWLGIHFVGIHWIVVQI